MNRKSIAAQADIDPTIDQHRPERHKRAYTTNDETACCSLDRLWQ